MVDEKLRLIITAEVKKAVKEMTTFRKASKDASSDVDTLKKKVGDWTRQAIGIGAAALSIRTMVSFLKGSVAAWQEQEQATAAFDAAMRALGRQTEITSDWMGTYASSLQTVTLYGDETITSGVALLEQLANLDRDGIQKLVPHVLDFATAFHIDLQSAFTIVGKTLGGTTNLLSRYGITVDATADKNTKLAQITEQLSKFQGQAAAAAQTGTGAMIQLKNVYGDLREEIGATTTNALKPWIEELTKGIQKSVEYLSVQRQISEEQRKLAGASGKKSIEDQITAQQQLLNLRRQQLAQADEAASKGRDPYGLNAALVKQLRQQVAEGESALAMLQHLASATSSAGGTGAAAGTDVVAEAWEKVKAAYVSAMEATTSADEKERISLQQNIVAIEAYLAGVVQIPETVEERNRAQERLNELLARQRELQGRPGENARELQQEVIGARMLADVWKSEAAPALSNYNDLLDQSAEKAATVETQMQAIKDAAPAIAAAVIPVFNAIGTAMASTGQEAVDAWTAVKEAAKQAVIGALNALAQEWLVKAIGYAAEAILTLNPQAGAAAIGFAAAGAAAASAAGVVAALAQGGTTSRSGKYLVGERGPELVNLPGQSTVTPLGAGGNVTIHVHGSVITERELMRKAYTFAVKKGRPY